MLPAVQAATQPPVILTPQPWQALQPGGPFPPTHAPQQPQSEFTPRDQILCDLVYLFNNVLRSYAPAIGHDIAHQPAAVADPTKQLVPTQAVAGSTMSVQVHSLQAC